MNSYVFIFALVCACAVALPAADRLTTKEEDEQNRNAQYVFLSDVDDRVSDLTLHRQEQRDGLAVTGSFAYSDGYVRRIVKYVADENGYRVLSDEAEPLQGPRENPTGVTNVRTVVDGQELTYSVQNEPRDTKRF